ncbi:MAG: hypothetical protein H3C48_20265 [Chitinophagaceae bacterium]|nr:hypothetical protein [Chitinophagaceae bacterium]
MIFLSGVSYLKDKHRHIEELLDADQIRKINNLRALTVFFSMLPLAFIGLSAIVYALLVYWNMFSLYG